MIELKNVNKQFKDVTIFKDISAKFENGKKILIKGSNGTGKSVLLKMIVGYSTPDSGEIIVDNYKVGVDKDFILNAGISINAPEFYDNWTGMENLLYLANIRKISTKEDITRLCEILEIDTKLNKKYKTYSLGMKQKMRIIQALIDRPMFLILDEPFDNLDFSSQKKVIDILNDFITNDKIIIFTTHNTEHEKFADKIYQIQNFKLEEI